MIRVLVALVAAVSSATARYHAGPKLPLLPLSVRQAGPVDIRGEYVLRDTFGDPSLCPDNITHTTWSRLEDGSIGVPHSTILEDSVRCDSDGEQRALRFYEATAYDDDFNPIEPDTVPLPQQLIDVMNASGLNKAARAANENFGERYLLGFESVIRVCKGTSNFGIGTTAFLMRPVDAQLTINNLDTPITAGLKWLLMVPRFKGTFCLYSSDVNGPDDAFRPLPQVSPEEPVASPDVAVDPTDPSVVPSFPPSPLDDDMLDDDMLDASDDPLDTEQPTRFPRPPPGVGPVMGGAPGDGDDGMETTPVSAFTPDPTDDDVGTGVGVGVGGGLGLDDATASPDSTLQDVEAETDATETAEDDDDDICFPGDATVTLEDGRRRRMHDIAIGDSVQVGARAFSQVFAFTHKHEDVRHDFVTLRTASATLSATTGHYVYVNGQARTIESARVGDSLTLANGEQAPIVHVGTRVSRGLYNPQTLHGDIVVDGVRATTYTRSVTPALAHAALAPVRALFETCGIDALTAWVPVLRTAWSRARSVQ